VHGVAAAEADQRVAVLGHVRNRGDRGDHEQVVAGRDAPGDRALQRGQPAERDQRPRLGPADVRGVVEDAPRARPAGGGELAREQLLGRGQEGDRKLRGSEGRLSTSAG
jgi:hypothetical protein